MRRWKNMGAAAAVVILALGAVPAGAGVVQVQYDGPMMGGPYGGPRGFGPDMGPGHDDGSGPYGGGFSRRRPREGSGRVGPFASYHGFRIDLGEAQGTIDVPSALSEVEHQIDIVDRSGLSPAMLARFRAVPIRLSVTLRNHYRGGPEVTLGSLQPNDDRPILLHEYMHVLEWRSFPGGFHNPTVQHYYDEARAGGLYEQGSYMMSNPAEFWAVTASCYLNGTVAREPYDRAAIRQRQPDYYAYLQRVFGPRGETASAGPIRGTGADR